MIPWEKQNQNMIPTKHTDTALKQISNTGFTPGAYGLC